MDIRISRAERNSALDAIAARHFGTFTWDQAISCGFCTSTVSDAVRDGVFRKVQPTVYTRDFGPLSIDARRAAALLAAGPASALVKFAALDVYRCSRFRRKTVQIGIARSCAKRLVGVDTFRCLAKEHGHVVMHAGHPVTSFAWTVTDLGAELQPEQIAHVIQQGRLRRRVEIAEITAVIQLRGSFRGCANVRAGLEMYLRGSAGSRSHHEDVVYGWVRELVRHPPDPNVHVAVAAEEFEIDVPFERHRLCVEVDGPLHDDPDQQRRDRVRDAALRAAGYTVVRIHWREIQFRPARARRRLVAALHASGVPTKTPQKVG